MADEAPSMDIVKRPEPALSATSDMPVPAPEAEVVDEAAKVADKSLTADAGEDTGSDKTPDEPTDGEDKSGDADKTTPQQRAAWTRQRNRIKAAEDLAAQAMRERDEALARIPKPPSPKDKPRPLREAFDDPDAYETALLNWNADQVRERTLEEAQSQQVRADQTRQVEQTLQTYNDRKAAFEQEHPDFEEIVYSDDLQLSAAMSQAILNAEDGPAIAYHLGQHPEEAERIAKLSPVQAVYEIGKISLRLQTPPSKPKPDPIRPLGARSGDGAADPANESMDQYGARRLAELRRRVN